MADVVILNNKQLRKLASLIFKQETLAIRTINFRSEPERLEYLQNCRANYDSIVGVLDGGVKLTQKFEDDKIKAPIANDIFEYIINCANSALQMVRNYTVRTDYLKKIREHVNSLVKELETLETSDATKAKQLAEAIAQYKKAMFEYTKIYQTINTQEFSGRVKAEGLTFGQLMARYQKESGHDDKPFKDLEELDKLEVFLKIMETARDGSVSVYRISTWAFGAGGPPLFLFVVGRLVWDAFSADHVIQQATKDAVVSVAAAGGAFLSDVITAAIATDLVGVEGTSVFLTMEGMVTGFIRAFLLGAAAGFLVDLIIGTGGHAFSTDGYRVYVAEMPDGKALAYQIAHDDNKNM